MYLLYSILMGLAALVTAPYWLLQGLIKGKYLSNLGQRLGFSVSGLDKLPAQRPGAIWIHAVSVGEAIAGIPLAKRLKDLEKENGKLKRLVAELALDKQILKDIAEGNF